MAKSDLGPAWHHSQLNAVDDEIARLAYICDIRILDAGVIERVVNGDATVCGKQNDKAFRQLRGLVGMHYSLTNDSLQSLGPEMSQQILAQIRERLGKKFDIGGRH